MNVEEKSRSEFGEILSQWRKRRRFSQLGFGLLVDVSARHISFLETGRANPSRDMVLKLTSTLNVPKVEVNRALLAAGYSPLYAARDHGDVDTAPLRRAINHILQGHSPFPGIVLDHHWNVIEANYAAISFLQKAKFASSNNLLEVLSSQSKKDSTIMNWDETIGLTLTRLRTELNTMGPDEVLQNLERNLAVRFEKHCANPQIDQTQAIIPTKFNIEGQEISLFSTIAQFGTVQDLTYDELKVELMFPMDEASENFFREN